MAINWPAIGNYSWGSSMKRTPKLEVNQMGDGYSVRIPMGMNNAPADMTIVYADMSRANFITLIAFIKANLGGQAITTPVLLEDISGATTGLYYISDYTISSDYLPSVSISLGEVFGA